MKKATKEEKKILVLDVLRHESGVAGKVRDRNRYIGGKRMPSGEKGMIEEKRRKLFGCA